MEKPVVGSVVAVRFPFSDLKSVKLRPALVVAMAEYDNFILCQITSKRYSSARAVKLASVDFATGGLPVVSYARPDKLFTADQSILVEIKGVLTANKANEVLSGVRKLFGRVG